MAQEVTDEKKQWDENCLKVAFPDDGNKLYKPYEPKGRFEVIPNKDSQDPYDNITVYISDPSNGNYKNVIIFIYDIFGWNGLRRFDLYLFCVSIFVFGLLLPISLRHLSKCVYMFVCFLLSN